VPAFSEGDVRGALLALCEQRAVAELLGRLTGELRERVVIEDEHRVYVAEWGKSAPPPLHTRRAAIDVTPPALASGNGNGS
jgi:hypothetical protein